MRRFRNAKIRTKLFLVFGALISFVVILAVFAIITIKKVETDFVNLTEGPSKRLTYASDAVTELSNIRRYILSMGYATEDADVVNSYYERYQVSARLFLRYLEDYDENLKDDVFLSDSEKEDRAKIVAEIKNRFVSDYRQYVSGTYSASIEHDRRRVDELVSTGIPMGDEITDMLWMLRTMVQDHVEEITAETQAYAAGAIKLMVTFALFIIILSLITSIFMSSAIRDPIIEIEAAMSEIAKGNLAYPIRSGYKDELGILSNRIGEMVDTISALNKAVTIIDNLEEMIFVTDLNYNLIYINQKAMEFNGGEKDECTGQKCYKIIYGVEEPCSFCPMPGMLPRKESFPICDWERHAKIEGKDIWFSCKTAIIRWVDGSLVQICTSIDNTLQKQHEEQRKRHEEELRKAALAAEEASRMKSSFLANMSHEIRTPMNGIVGFSELALDDNISPRTKDYLNKIKSSSEGLLQIINNILDLSKIEVGKIVIEHIPFDIHDVFNICQTLTAPKALEKGITLFCYAEPSVGKMLVGDPTRLRQVLLNLLSNAVKFTNYGMVKLLSSVNDVDENSITVHFEIKDSGIGMTREQLEKIFDPFTQADDSTTRRYGGTGLGLSITKNIIELMGGALDVESAVGIGSKFSFDLTFETVEILHSVSDNKTAPVQLEKPRFKGEVLVCEDNSLNQMVIREHLSRVGLDAVIAANGKEGVDTVAWRMDKKERPFDLILMDIHMPVMDGLEAAKKLGEMGNKTPIVAITANVMITDREIYQQYGMPEYVAKPFTSQELWSCLLKYLTPVQFNAADSNEQSDADEKLQKRLITNFVKDNQTTTEDMSAAIQKGDIKLAHRMAHTLKGVAGLVGKTTLQEAAYAVERMLADGKTESVNDQMDILGIELNKALGELSSMSDSQESQTPEQEAPIDREKALELIKKLEPLLEAGNSECLELMNGLRSVPKAEILIRQVEDYDFNLAIETLAGIKRELEVSE